MARAESVSRKAESGKLSSAKSACGGLETGNGVLEFPPELVEKTKESFSSYLAHFAAGNSEHLVKAIKREFGFADEFLKYFNIVRPHFFVNKRQSYEFFKKNLQEAHAVMLEIHTRGFGVCGVYTYEVAESKASKVMKYAKDHGFPLKCSTDPVEN